MTLRRAASIVLLAGLTAMAGQAAYRVWETPRTIMARMERAVAGAAEGYNRCFHRRSLALRPGGIRRPNPDVLPTTVAYDLSAGALHLTGPVWEPYWSLSVYAHNSDNIFVINDRELESGRFDVLISAAPATTGSGTVNVVSPSTTGLVVIRRLAADTTMLPALHRNQDRMACRVIPQGAEA